MEQWGQSGAGCFWLNNGLRYCSFHRRENKPINKLMNKLINDLINKEIQSNNQLVK